MAEYTNRKQGRVGTQVQVADTQHTRGVGGNTEVPLRETETLRLEMPVSPVSPSVREQLLVEEYIGLRSEIEKRVEIRQQILALTLLVAGTFLTVGVQPGVPEVVLLFYPVIAMFLGAIWEHNDLRVGQLNFYIRTEIEKLFGDAVPGWETFRLRTFRVLRQKQYRPYKRYLYQKSIKSAHPLTSQFSLVVFATRGMFLTTQAMAISVAILRYTYDLWQGGLATHLLEPRQLGLSVVMVLLFLLDSSVLVATRYLVQHKR